LIDDLPLSQSLPDHQATAVLVALQVFGRNHDGVDGGTDAPDLMREIYMGLIGVGTAVDAIVSSPEDLERYKDSRGRVSREALGEGKVVYPGA